MYYFMKSEVKVSQKKSNRWYTVQLVKYDPQRDVEEYAAKVHEIWYRRAYDIEECMSMNKCSARLCSLEVMTNA